MPQVVDPLALALGTPARADRLLVLGVAVVALGGALLRLALPAPLGARPR